MAIGPLAAIANVSSGPAPAGDISVNVAGQLSVRGNPAEPNVDARPQTGITSQSLGPGNAGNVAIKAGNLTIVGVAAIGSVVVGSGSGDAGTVSVNVAGQLAIDGGIPPIRGDHRRPGDDCCPAVGQTLHQFRSGVLAESMTGHGKAGTITITAGSLSLTNEGQIVSNTFGSEDAGRISVNVAGAAILDGGYINASSIGGSGNGGIVTVAAPSLSVADGGSIWTAAVIGFGNGGDLSLEVPAQLTVDGGASGFASIMAWTLATATAVS